MKKLIIPLLLLLALPLTAQTEKQHNFKIAKNLELFNDVYRYLDAMYVDTLDADTIIPMGINAMLSTMDPYTEFFPEENKKDFQQMIAGKYAGIGAIIHHNYKLDCTVIWEPYAGMPAAEVADRVLVTATVVGVGIASLLAQPRATCERHARWGFRPFHGFVFAVLWEILMMVVILSWIYIAWFLPAVAV